MRTPQRKRWRRSVITVALAAAFGAATLTAPASAAQDDPPGEDEIAHSDNMKHLANVPFKAPLDDGPTGTDIAFTDGHAIVGNYLGFTIYNVKKPSKPKIVSNIACLGAQNDVSVYKNLLFLSVDARMTDDSCEADYFSGDGDNYWEGVRVFDISNKKNPKYVQSVETKCGSHTHTMIPPKKGKKDVHIYVSSYGPSEDIARCQPPHDKISVIKVPVNKPEKAKVAAEPKVFPDGGYTAPGENDINTQGGMSTSGCHDITAYPEKNIAAGACMGDGVIWNISNPLKPKEIDRVTDEKNFAFWHSATFSNDAKKIVFTDELGGGGAATCNAETPKEYGADAIYDVKGHKDHRKLKFRSYFKIDRNQTDDENCVAHNGSLIPVPGKDIMVQSWYMGGTQVWDFSDSKRPKKIGYFERGPAAKPEEAGGTWSSYYYNGHIYSSDLGKGLDVLRIDDRRTNPAKNVKMKTLNVQTQQSYSES